VVRTAKILGYPVNLIGLEETVALLEKLLLAAEEGEKARLRVVTLNPEMLMLGQMDPRLDSALQRADLIVPDGIGIVWALRRAGYKRQQRVTGVDLVESLLTRMAPAGLKVYLLGGEPGVAEAAAAQLQNRWPQVQVVGCHHGYFAEEMSPGLIKEINAAEPALLLAGMGVPRQETWLAEHWPALKVPLGIGVGGLLDLWAGRTVRAPRFLQRIGLEWAFRAWKEPQRLKRLRVLPKFIWRVWREQRDPVGLGGKG